MSTRAGNAVENEMFSNFTQSECQENCKTLTGVNKTLCISGCMGQNNPAINSNNSTRTSTNQDWGGILSGVAELVNAGGGIYATHIAGKGGQYIPQNYPNTFSPETPLDPAAEDLRKKKNTTNILLGVGGLVLVGVLLYFGLREQK